MDQSMGHCRPENDDTFGPVVVDCRNGFDFTLLFEEAIFSIVPSTLFLCVVSYRLAMLHGVPVKTIRPAARPWKIAKQSTIACLSVLQLILVVLWTRHRFHPTRLSVAAAVVSLASYLSLLTFSYAAHDRLIRPSTTISNYLCLSILLDLAKVRTLWLRQNDLAVAAICTSIVALKGCLLCLETYGKRVYLLPAYRNLSPEVRGGVLATSFLWWVNSLLRKGYTNVLSSQDLFPLDTKLESRRVHLALKRAWGRSDKKSSQSLFVATISCFWKPILYVAVPRFALTGFTFCQPVLTSRLLDTLTATPDQTTTDVGRALIGATALVYLGIALSTARYKQLTNRYMTMMRGGLVTLIYDTTLSLERGTASKAASVTLMSTDVEVITTGFQWSDGIWAAPVELAVAIYLLSTRIQASCVAPVILSVSLIVIGMALGGAAAKEQQAWVSAIEHRVAATASMLDNFKSVRMTGLSDMFTASIQDLRVRELQTSSKFRHIVALLAIISNLSGAVIPILTLIVYVLVERASTGVQLNPSVAFTSISLVTLLAASIQKLTAAVVQMAGAVGCFQRIQKYLLENDKPGIEDEQVEEKEGHVTLNESQQENRQTALIKAKSAVFAVKRSGPIFLHNITLEIYAGTMIALIGGTGSGKSMLIHGLLGELPLVSGELSRSPSLRVGYCAQESWLPSLSIRSVIMGDSSSVDEQWYQTVIEACALTQDLELLPDGDRTMIGSQGSNLSGGQKQRISLARAIYSKPQLLLLDDVFSGLDQETEQSVHRRIFGRAGLCRQLGMACLLVSKTVVESWPADCVIVMADGSIISQGKPELLNKQILQRTEASGIHGNDQEQTNESITPQSVDQQMHVSSEEPSAAIRGLTGVNMTGPAPQRGDVRLYAYYFRHVGWLVALTVGASCAVFALGSKFPTIWLKWWSDAQQDNSNPRTNMYMSVYGSFCAVSFCALLACIYPLALVGTTRSSNQLHLILLKKVMSAPYWLVVKYGSGELLNRFSQDMSMIDLQLPIAVADVGLTLSLCIAEAALIAVGSKWVALLYIPLLGALYFLQSFYLRTSQQMRILDLELKSPLYTHFLETLQGLTTLRAFGWAESAKEQNQKLTDTSQQPFYMMLTIQQWLTLVLDLIVAVVAVIVVALATQIRGSSSAGSLGVSFVNILSFSSSLSGLISVWTNLETSLGAVWRVKTFEKTTPSEHQAAERELPPTDWPSTGRIVFDNVNCTYQTGSRHVLESITLDIKSGQKVAICGRTGSGKTSLILALLRIIELTKGEIFLDGVPISRLPRDYVRQAITTVSQDPLVLPGSVRFNADPTNIHTDEAIRAALVELGIWDVIASRGGMDADMHMFALSKGEQQLFCLARALLAKPRILILDEVTSSLDRVYEERVISLLRLHFPETTILMIVHYLPLTEDFDEIIVMKDGEVAQFGDPSQLMEQDGIYQKLRRLDQA